MTLLVVGGKRHQADTSASAMTLQQYRMIKATWVVFCTALLGVPAFLFLNWQIGLLVGGLAALAVNGILNNDVDFVAADGNFLTNNSKGCEPADDTYLNNRDWQDDPARSFMAGNHYNGLYISDHFNAMAGNVYNDMEIEKHV